MTDRFEEMVSAEINRATGRALVVRHDEQNPDPLDHFGAPVRALRDRSSHTGYLRTKTISGIAGRPAQKRRIRDRGH